MDQFGILFSSLFFSFFKIHEVCFVDKIKIIKSVFHVNYMRDRAKVKAKTSV